MGENKYIAHINNNNDIQTCNDHSFGTAKIARDKLSVINLGNIAFLAGILHDAGKYSDEFKKYILDAHSGKIVRKGSVIHSFTGASFILKKYHSGDLDAKDVTAEIIAYAIASHHGLFDSININGEIGFNYRINKQPQYDDKAISHFFKECISEKNIDDYFKLAQQEIELKLKYLQSNYYDDNCDNKDYIVTLFNFGMVSRLILSSVIDGDRTDTFNFMTDINSFQNTIDWDKYLNNVELYLSSKEFNTPIQKARKELSDLCAHFATNEPDIYELKLPTGAGKTLSSLRYALIHAKLFNKKRIFYIAPLISILEQNAEVIKNAVNDPSIVLEHHSNVIIEDDTIPDEYGVGIDKDRYQLLAENWNSPIVITTLVQFLNTLFGSKTSQVRRFSSLVDSVVILDEVQTVPSKMLSLFNLAMNFLKNVCNTTILLCSATQPAFSDIDYKMFVSDKRIMTKEKEVYYYNVFKRSNIVFDGGYRLEEIPEYILGLLYNSNSVLIVCNKKSQSVFLYNSIKNDGYDVFHLSASMCINHREDVLDELSKELCQNKKVICIATQVIEAGVDISFNTVVRFQAGLDSIVQADGRCNRNGEFSGDTKTHIIRCLDEDLIYLEEIRESKNATTQLLEEFKNNEEKYNNTFDSDLSINTYYNFLYDSYVSNKTYYYIKKYDDTILNLLSDNNKFRNNGSGYIINQAFKTAGEEFAPLDCNTISVLVPYKNGIDIITNLCSEKAEYDIFYAKEQINKAKRYSISLMEYHVKKLSKEDAIYKIYNDSIYVLREGYYSNEVGIVDRKEEDEECSILIL